MTQIKVFTHEDIDGTVLSHLRPRPYMTSYSLKQLIDYTRKELYWNDIDVNDVVAFEIFNKYEHWTVYIDE